MILCLDIGNHQIFGGIYSNAGQLHFQFRYNSRQGASSDELGVFLRNVLRENQIDPDHVEEITLCSVVPQLVHSIRSACIKYFSKIPFILKPGAKTGLKICCQNPQEIGTDRIANAVASSHLYPGRDLIVLDFGTATTLCVVSKNKEYLGGAILAGLKISIGVLQSKTAQLPLVEIIKPKKAIGLNTEENLQSGVFYGTLGALKELVYRSSKEAFKDDKPLVIGTGGFARLFMAEGIFDEFVPDLILQGLYISLLLNRKVKKIDDKVLI